MESFQVELSLVDRAEAPQDALAPPAPAEDAALPETAEETPAGEDTE